jgi:tRNA-splicing ligase RtcB (3'-phosphate/5'-hydroxy nucleic acid ligase)
MEIAVRGDVDQRAVEQLRRCAEAGDAVAGALCADGHVGYSQPIGGVVAYPEHISPSGVGYDIACLAAGTAVTSADGYFVPIEDVSVGDPVTGWDTRSLRRVVPCDGALARGRRPLRRLTLALGRELHLTDDHQVRTKLGWTRADDLALGDVVACAPFVGLPFERADVAIPVEVTSPPGALRDRTAGLAARGLLPLHAADERMPALLRLLAYCAGDGHLGTDGKTIAWYTNSRPDVADLQADLARVGFSGAVHERVDRGQHVLLLRSVELHALFAGLGCPVGEKVYRWPERPFEWLFALPAWQRGVFLSSLMSAEGSTPALAPGTPYVAALAIKQSGVTDAAIQFVRRLFASLGFVVNVTPSGAPHADGRQSYVAQLQGGESEILRYLREIGFNRAASKRAASAAMLSVAAQREAALAVRTAAIAEAARLKAGGRATVREITNAVAARFGVPPALVHHGLYGRGAPRVATGWRPEPDHSGDVAWLPVVANQATGASEDVYDVVTGDPAACFLAHGVVVHNCGNKAVRTDLLIDDLRPDLGRVMDTIFDRISFGVGRKNDEPVDHPVLDRIREADFRPQRALRDLAAKQLGTVGAGNHYVDLFAGDDDHVWVGVHFGSRGFGHKTASGFLALAAGRRFDERGPEGEMDSPPVLLHVDSELGQAYVAAMQLAGEYAYAGRDVVVDRVLEILGARSTYEVHNHHNYGFRERHHGVDVWVIRKGCTPAFPGQEGFVGATMGEPSVILRGTDRPEGAELLYSTVHGAGRVMSRTQAAGKVGARAECSDRDCGFWVRWSEYRRERQRRGIKEGERFTLCPEHPDGTMHKRRGRIKDGLIDFGSVRRELTAGGIELRGGAADEAPGAYKRLDDVLAAHGDTIEIVHRLTPVGVAMAGADTFDPYKD